MASSERFDQRILGLHRIREEGRKTNGLKSFALNDFGSQTKGKPKIRAANPPLRRQASMFVGFAKNSNPSKRSLIEQQHSLSILDTPEHQRSNSKVEMAINDETTHRNE